MKRSERDRERIMTAFPDPDRLAALLAEVRAETYEEIAVMADKNFGAMSSSVLRRKATRARSGR